jgi:hypothetical protein
MDAHIHSKSTTSASSTADTGFLPPALASLLDEEQSIIATMQCSLVWMMKHPSVSFPAIW